MMNAIFAVDEAGGIGYQNTMPWPTNKEDMDWFRSNTVGDVVVMGRKTWDSDMPTPLPRRENWVVTHDHTLQFNGATRWPLETLSISEIPYILPVKYPNKTIWVIGGAALLDSFKGSYNRIYMTLIKGVYTADTFIDVDSMLKSYERIYLRKAETAEFMIYEKL